MTSSQYDFETEYDPTTRRVVPGNIYSTDPKRGGHFLDWRKLKEKIPFSFADKTFFDHGDASRFLIMNDGLRRFLEDVVWPEVSLRLRKDAPIHRDIIPSRHDPSPVIRFREKMIKTMDEYEPGQKFDFTLLLQDTLSACGLIMVYPSWFPSRAGQYYI